MSLVVTVDRTVLSLAPLVLSGENGGTTTIGVSAFTEPATQARVRWAPDSSVFNGAVALGSVLQQGSLGFSGFVDRVSFAAALSAIEELKTAVVSGQLNFSVTRTIGGVATTWRCQPGQVVHADWTYSDVQDRTPQFSVTLPCDPVPV